MPGVRVEDGQNVLTVFEAVTEAVERARAGDGPSLVEVMTYRFNEHSEGLRLSVDYRDADEKQRWLARDPIAIFRDHLIDEGFASEAELDRMEDDVMIEVEDAVTFTDESPYPDAGDAFKDLYTDSAGGTA